MDILVPHHATLPLWTEKDTREKQIALSKMATDLVGFSVRLKQNDPIGTDEVLAKLLETRRIGLLNDFDQLFRSARIELLDDLKGTFTEDEIEAKDIAKITDLIQQHPDFLTVGCEAGHVTGSALIVDVRERSLLLHRHRKLNRWFQFGGHPDFELNMLDVARREASEESGIHDLELLTNFARRRTPIDVEVQEIPETTSRPAHVHADFRYVFAAPHLSPRISSSEESEDFWILRFSDALAEADEISEPSVKRLISKAERLVTTYQTQLQGEG